MKTICNLIICLLLSLSSVAQTSSIIDSLKLELQKKQEDTIQAQILNDLAYYYLYQDIDTSLVFGKRAYKFATKIKYPKIQAKANLYIGNAFLFTNKYDSARYYYDKSYKIFDKEGLNKSAIYSSLGMLHKNEGNYEQAIEIYFKGIAYDEETNDEYGKFIKLLNLANVYYIIEDYNKSIKYQKQAVTISEKTDNKNIKYALGTVLNNIGGNYAKIHEFDKALDFFNKSLVVNLKNENNKELARNYNNIGAIYEKKGKLNKAIPLLKKALSIREQLGDEDELVETHMELGTIYGKLLQNTSANYHFDKAIFYGNKINNLALLSEVYLAKSDIFLFQNNSKEALINFKSHSQFRDSILKADNIKSINEIEVKYETVKKEKEIISQQLQLKENENELQKKASQSNYMLGIIVFLLMASILTWFLYQQREKRKNQELLTLKREYQIKTLESLIEGEEKERFRIAKELHDGVNGDLSAIKYKLSSLLEMNNKVIKEAITMIDDSCKQVRAISHNLVPPALENFDLVEATSDYIRSLNDVNPDISILFQHIGETIKITKEAEVNTFRIIQELVTNGVKHAKASFINVQISCRENNIQITVEDDGVGFKKNEITSNGIGLDNVQSRISYLNATLDFVSNDQGTSYTIEIDKDQLNDN